MNVVQKNFSAGLNFISDDCQIAEDGYLWAINCRNRFGRLQPIPKNVQMEIPAGLLQGGITIGNINIIFVAGKAYWQAVDGLFWTNIPAFQMSTTETQFYAQDVPASSFNFVRKLAANGNIQADILVTTDFKVNGTPAAIVVQDGVNQPWLIFYDSVNQVFTSRVSGDYDGWENTSQNPVTREYVPIGKQMMLLNDILCIVAPDGKSMYRSLTGRYLDFMLNIDTDGDKLPSEVDGGAQSTSQVFDFDAITCLIPLDIPDSFIWGTRRNTRIVTADYTKKIFGEPTFRMTSLLEIGVRNQFSFCTGLNDFISIESSGIKSFNAVQQLKFKGNNSIFSLQVSKLLYNSKTRKQIKQQKCACINFNDYVIACLDTYLGNILIVYDCLREQWVSLDITRVTQVKQFMVAETEDEVILYALTHKNKMFRMFSGTTTELAQLRGRSLVADNTNTEHKGARFRAMLKSGTYDGICVLREFVDDQESVDNYESQDLLGVASGVTFPVRAPVIPMTKKMVDNPSFSITQGLKGKKISFVFQWTNDAELIEFQVDTSEEQNMASGTQQEKAYKDTYVPTSDN